MPKGNIYFKLRTHLIYLMIQDRELRILRMISGTNLKLLLLLWGRRNQLGYYLKNIEIK